MGIQRTVPSSLSIRQILPSHGMIRHQGLSKHALNKANMILFQKITMVTLMENGAGWSNGGLTWDSWIWITKSKVRPKSMNLDSCLPSWIFYVVQGVHIPQIQWKPEKNQDRCQISMLDSGKQKHRQLTARSEFPAQVLWLLVWLGLRPGGTAPTIWAIGPWAEQEIQSAECEKAWKTSLRGLTSVAPKRGCIQVTLMDTPRGDHL